MPQGFLLDLANSLSREVHSVPDLFERLRFFTFKAETPRDNLSLSPLESIESLDDLFWNRIGVQNLALSMLVRVSHNEKVAITPVVIVGG